MADDRLSRTLDACLAELRSGASVEDCLRRYPDLRRELSPLLRTAARVHTDATVVLNREGRATARARLVAQINRPAARKPAGGGFGWLRLAALPTLAAAIGLALFLGLNTLQAPVTSEAATTLTILQGSVTIVGPSGASVAASDGQVLNPGDRIVTSDGGRAVVTFFDGSTVTLESATDVSIQAVDASSGQLSALLRQSQGRTWTHIPRALSPAQIEIDTPVARVQTTDAQFLTAVDDSGQTWVGAQAGAVALSSGDMTTEVRGGFQTRVERKGKVNAPSANAQSDKDLVITVSGPVLALLTAPDEASVGALASGVPVNQVSGASTRLTHAGFEIRVPEAAPGEYHLTFRATDVGDLAVSASLGHAGNTALALDPVAIETGEDWSVSFTLNSGELELGEPERLDTPPTAPRVTAPPLAEERAGRLLDVTPTIEATETGTPTPTGTPALTPTVSPSATPTVVNGDQTPSLTPTGTVTVTATPALVATATP